MALRNVVPLELFIREWDDPSRGELWLSISPHVERSDLGKWVDGKNAVAGHVFDAAPGSSMSQPTPVTYPGDVNVQVVIQSNGSDRILLNERTRVPVITNAIKFSVDNRGKLIQPKAEHSVPQPSGAFVAAFLRGVDENWKGVPPGALAEDVVGDYLVLGLHGGVRRRLHEDAAPWSSLWRDPWQVAEWWKETRVHLLRLPPDEVEEGDARFFATNLASLLGHQFLLGTRRDPASFWTDITDLRAELVGPDGVTTMFSAALEPVGFDALKCFFSHLAESASLPAAPSLTLALAPDLRSRVHATSRSLRLHPVATSEASTRHVVVGAHQGGRSKLIGLKATYPKEAAVPESLTWEFATVIRCRLVPHRGPDPRESGAGARILRLEPLRGQKTVFADELATATPFEKAQVLGAPADLVRLGVFTFPWQGAAECAVVLYHGSLETAREVTVIVPRGGSIVTKRVVRDDEERRTTLETHLSWTDTDGLTPPSGQWNALSLTGADTMPTVHASFDGDVGFELPCSSTRIEVRGDVQIPDVELAGLPCNAEHHGKMSPSRIFSDDLVNYNALNIRATAFGRKRHLTPWSQVVAIRSPHDRTHEFAMAHRFPTQPMAGPPSCKPEDLAKPDFAPWDDVAALDEAEFYRLARRSVGPRQVWAELEHKQCTTLPLHSAPFELPGLLDVLPIVPSEIARGAGNEDPVHRFLAALVVGNRAELAFDPSFINPGTPCEVRRAALRALVEVEAAERVMLEVTEARFRLVPDQDRVAITLEQSPPTFIALDALVAACTDLLDGKVARRVLVDLPAGIESRAHAVQLALVVERPSADVPSAEAPWKLYEVPEAPGARSRHWTDPAAAQPRLLAPGAPHEEAVRKSLGQWLPQLAKRSDRLQARSPTDETAALAKLLAEAVPVASRLAQCAEEDSAPIDSSTWQAPAAFKPLRRDLVTGVTLVPLAIPPVGDLPGYGDQTLRLLERYFAALELYLELRAARLAGWSASTAAARMGDLTKLVPAPTGCGGPAAPAGAFLRALVDQLASLLQPVNDDSATDAEVKKVLKEWSAAGGDVSGPVRDLFRQIAWRDIRHVADSKAYLLTVLDRVHPDFHRLTMRRDPGSAPNEALQGGEHAPLNHRDARLLGPQRDRPAFLETLPDARYRSEFSVPQVELESVGASTRPGDSAIMLPLAAGSPHVPKASSRVVRLPSRARLRQPIHRRTRAMKAFQSPDWSAAPLTAISEGALLDGRVRPPEAGEEVLELVGRTPLTNPGLPRRLDQFVVTAAFSISSDEDGEFANDAFPACIAPQGCAAVEPQASSSVLAAAGKTFFDELATVGDIAGFTMIESVLDPDVACAVLECLKGKPPQETPQATTGQLSITTVAGPLPFSITARVSAGTPRLEAFLYHPRSVRHLRPDATPGVTRYTILVNAEVEVWDEWQVSLAQTRNEPMDGHPSFASAFRQRTAPSGQPRPTEHAPVHQWPSTMGPLTFPRTTRLRDLVARLVAPFGSISWDWRDTGLVITVHDEDQTTLPVTWDVTDPELSHDRRMEPARKPYTSRIFMIASPLAHLDDTLEWFAPPALDFQVDLRWRRQSSVLDLVGCRVRAS